MVVAIRTISWVLKNRLQHLKKLTVILSSFCLNLLHTKFQLNLSIMRLYVCLCHFFSSCYKCKMVQKKILYRKWETKNQYVIVLFPLHFFLLCNNHWHQINTNHYYNKLMEILFFFICLNDMDSVYGSYKCIYGTFESRYLEINALVILHRS